MVTSCDLNFGSNFTIVLVSRELNARNRNDVLFNSDISSAYAVRHQEIFDNTFFLHKYASSRRILV